MMYIAFSKWKHCCSITTGKCINSV